MGVWTDGWAGVRKQFGIATLDEPLAETEWVWGKGQYGWTAAALLAAASYSAVQPKHMMENPAAAACGARARVFRVHANSLLWDNPDT